MIDWCLFFWSGSVVLCIVLCGRSLGYFWYFLLLCWYCVVDGRFVVCCWGWLFWLSGFVFRCLVLVLVDVGFWWCWYFCVGLFLGSVWCVIVGRCKVDVCWYGCWWWCWWYCIVLVFVWSWLRRSRCNCDFCSMIVG